MLSSGEFTVVRSEHSPGWLAGWLMQLILSVYRKREYWPLSSIRHPVEVSSLLHNPCVMRLLRRWSHTSAAQVSPPVRTQGLLGKGQETPLESLLCAAGDWAGPVGVSACMQEGLAYRPALFLERRSEDDSSADKPKKHRDPISWIASMEGKEGNGRAGSSEDAEKSPSDQKLAGEKDSRRATDQGPRGDKEAVAGGTSSRRQVVAKERTNAAMKSDRYRHRQGCRRLAGDSIPE
jgi:hypothetical protein